MSQNLRINGVDYNGVDSLSIPNTDGELVQYVEHIPEVIGETVATIGTAEYDSAEKALANAVSGETVLMVADSVENDLIIPEGVILDLNGHTVSAVTVGSAGDISDTTLGVGKLIVTTDDVVLSSTNTLMPLYDEDGYRFTKFSLLSANPIVNADGTIRYMVICKLDTTAQNYAYLLNLLQTTFATTKLCWGVYASYPDKTATGIHLREFSADLVMQYFTNPNNLSNPYLYTNLTLTVPATYTLRTFLKFVGEKFCVEYQSNAKTYTVAEPATVAKIGEVEYSSVEKALAAAVSGDTVLMVANAEEGNLVVPDGVTLDLNGMTLTANSVFGEDGSDVVDNSTDNTGLLKTQKTTVSLSKANSQLPVYNGTDGYVFSSISKFNQLVQDNGDGTKLYVFQVFFEPFVHGFIANGAASCGVTVETNINVDDNTNYQSVYPDTNVSNFVNSYNSSTGEYSIALNATVNAQLLAQATGMTVGVVVRSVTGAELYSDALTLN